ncbi:RNA 2'-phosphotransferase [Fodinibius sp. SL11]|uniref:RNA 2'-phosphotransferase n=1 Tax=Fodinibius sp. SL11 TaxID=3425690 RepID=UPI003F884676
MDFTAASKFLSYVLRHHPEAIGIELDDHGWANIDDLLEKAQNKGKDVDRDIIWQIIANSAKQRFILSSDKKYIRAGYGHSIDVDLQLKPKTPPEKLYHGTDYDNVAPILEDGIKAQSRNFVHLSTTIEEARKVGSRHGKPEILIVFSKQMSKDRYRFYQSQSEASVWLTPFVPPQFLKRKS